MGAGSSTTKKAVQQKESSPRAVKAAQGVAGHVTTVQVKPKAGRTKEVDLEHEMQQAATKSTHSTAAAVAPVVEDHEAETPAEELSLHMMKITAMLTGRSADAERLFHQYDRDRDALLSPQEVYLGLESWGLHLRPDMFSQFVDCNFLYADRDADGNLSLVEWTQLFKLMSEVAKKFNKCDLDRDGMINKKDFAAIVSDLDLKLTPAMLQQYVDVNFKFVDRTLMGKISFGQFLACYANFLYSYEISQGMRRRREAQQAAQKKQLEPVAGPGHGRGKLDQHADGDVLAHAR